jgi:hypothetical protein
MRNHQVALFLEEQTLRIQDSTIPTRRMTVASWTSSKVQPPEFGPPKAWKASSWVARNVPFTTHPWRVYSFTLYDTLVNLIWDIWGHSDTRNLRIFPESRSHRWRNLWGNSSRCLLSEPSSVRESLASEIGFRPTPWMAQVFCGACQVCHFEALIFSCRLYSFCSSAFRWLSEISRKGAEPHLKIDVKELKECEDQWCVKSTWESSGYTVSQNFKTQTMRTFGNFQYWISVKTVLTKFHGLVWQLLFLI